jgi:pSer/pThr/pTyr-binding forkhead associated (FHA) protein
MLSDDQTGNLSDQLDGISDRLKNCGLFVAYAPPGTVRAERFPIPGSLTIGRGVNAQLRIADNRVSRSHLRIDLDGDRALVEDLGSKNGSYINGQRLTGRPLMLEDDDLIHAGRVLLVFHVGVRQLGQGTRGVPQDLKARLGEDPLPSLDVRRVDIPSVFDHLLGRELERAEIDPKLIGEIMGDAHYESLIIDCFPTDNLGGFVDLAEKIAARVGSVTNPANAVASVFAERFGAWYPTASPPDVTSDLGVTAGFTVPPPTLTQEQAWVEKAYRNVGGNPNAIRNELLGLGFDLSVELIGKILDQLELPRNHKGKG